uniref:Dynamin-type G domain-containing protein n=1 Tax=Skeletonema marinoi TaxID=267567 RepID=A0A7S2PYV9_9STRA|mmetsp:Transcript_6172/g.10314  ORF Transcript_6172/g.10314 Transcript_6172/m.10314 type:complete len:655 (+) Transcript_6172:99-2063(+)
MSASITSSASESSLCAAPPSIEVVNNKNEEEHQDIMPSVSTESTNTNDGGILSADDASTKFIVQRLKELYRNHVVNAEKQYHLHFNFSLPTDGEIKESEFDAAPMVLLIGQYSTGKTTFLNHLLGEDFPGMHIGPEPTTDKFMALFHSGDKDDTTNTTADAKTIKNAGFRKKNKNNTDDDASFKTTPSIVTDDIRAAGRLVKGNTLTVTPNLPFSSLSQFGSAFLNHFVGSASTSPLLKRLTFIDTPGVLSGEKQRLNRTYDFGQVAKWFADRSDLILLLFDAHKLDISDEFKHVIDVIRHHNDDKIRCVLNKADCVTREQLVRVYGSLMWSMGKIFDSPEVVRVYTGSYWNGNLINNDFEKMFTKDEKLLVRELIDLPRCAAERKVNQMVNRIRLVKVHICILGTIRNMTPRFFGKKRSREQILAELDVILDNVRVEFNLSKGDMPDAKEFAANLNKFHDFSVFPPINRSLIKKLDSLVEKDIPEIVSQADVVSSETLMSQVDEKIEQPSAKEEVEVVKEATAAVEKAKKADANVLRVLGRIITFLLLLVVSVEAVYYISFGNPAYSLPELKSGYSKLFDTAKNYPKVSEIKSQITSKIQTTSVPPSSVPVSGTAKQRFPLSSLPTKSGVSFEKKDTQPLKNPSSDSDSKAEL